jgi:hypothetical protein
MSGYRIAAPGAANCSHLIAFQAQEHWLQQIISTQTKQTDMSKKEDFEYKRKNVQTQVGIIADIHLS